ncbi:MAG TPA: HAD family phosphatase [Lacipirellulaceae bacterium]|jgi:HAD superfamily hydrolase (TIGR01509 family)|nr:HAD family phosphatase [Lacipirellulaceae bacterium]
MENFSGQNARALRAVVCDLDGVLANTEDLYEEACSAVLGRRGLTYDPPLREQMMGRPVADALRIMIEAHNLPDPIEALFDECREVLYGLMATALAPMPGVVELLDRLSAAKLPAAVATSALPEYAEFVLTQLDIKRRFQFVLTSADVKHGKPDPEVYLLAGQRLELPPGEMMVLEDSANGCRAAVAAGAFTVAVPNRHTAQHDFSGARFVANTLCDPRIPEVLSL